MINIYSSSRYKLNKKRLTSYAQEVLNSFNGAPSSVLNIAFVGKRKMKEVARTYKNEDVALPVLSFSYLKDPILKTEHVIGEIVICYPQAVLLAAQRRKMVDNMMEELVKHGLQNIFLK
ncbi:MAG: rRNA maturation RNase YbeY [bacterium]|nr:rRNA maturation RNase YbeY [bacterium]